MLFAALGDQEVQMLVDGLARGEYHLLLGAGASIGCIGGDGRTLPNTSTLANELLTDFQISTGGEKIDLREAYDVINSKKDSEGRDRYQYLKDRFSNCEPTWQYVLANFRWRRVWTLNIDDAVERAYAKTSDLDSQKPKTYDWTSLYSEPDRGQDELQIIHLHGYARYLECSKENLVFSIIEYLRASSSKHAWHRIFGDEFLQRPFIVVGAKLTDEYDLAEFLRRGNDSKITTGRFKFKVHHMS